MKISNKMQRFLRICFRSYFIILSAVILVLFSVSLSFAGNVTFVKEYTYQASELDSKASCRTISLEMVKRLLLEELGTYLISETEVKDFKLTKEQVKTYSAGIVGAEIIEDKWDGKTYWLKAKVSADPKEVQKSLKKIIGDKYQAKQLEETRKKAEELTKEVERLNKELAKATNKQPSQKVQQEYKAAIKGLTAIEWLEKGLSAGMADSHNEAIDAFTKVIELKPDFAEAYYIRGLVYDYLSNYQLAIKDYTKSIELNPDWRWHAHYARGLVYAIMRNYQQAIKDYTKAIALNPKDARIYKKRGFTYYMLNEYQLSIKDYDKVIEIDPQDAEAYVYRGTSYRRLRNIQEAIKDYTKAIKIDPKNSEAYIERGDAYSAIGFVSGDLGYYQLAVKDFTRAIELNPQDAQSAYSGRGFAYSELGNLHEAIRDYTIAARLGDKDAQEFLKEQGIKW